MARILFIDDDQSLLDIFSEMLRERGYEVETAINGKDGIKLLGARNYDIVITDIVMPEKDGLEIITNLKKQSSPVSIIAISGGSQRLGAGFVLEMARVMKVDLVLPKPFTPTQLLEAVESVLLAKG